ncbi:MAG: hypothetical protein M1536_01355 [Firmicutes bacterium]|nr:hypothetical protein [Bacillota bacterium]
MNVDFSHPVNTKVLEYLKNPYFFYLSQDTTFILRCLSLRENDLVKIKASQSPKSVEKPYISLGTHPDVVERLWDEITVNLPESCRWVIYGTAVLVHPVSGIIFGWAEGTHVYTLRLPDKVLEEALRAGAKRIHSFSSSKIILRLSLIGEEWILGGWLEAEKEWCLQAYNYAAKLAGR